MIKNETLSNYVSERLRDRPRFAKEDRLDHIHRHYIEDQSVLFNEMYRTLAEDKLSNEQCEVFLSEYFYGSNKGFIEDVLPAAQREIKNPFYREYITHIRKEEFDPKCHSELYLEMLEEIGVSIKERQAASEKFIERSVLGYTECPIKASGYALAVEVEADYQMAIVYDFIKRHFDKETINNNLFFEVHLDEDGEEEHARQTIEMAEAIVKSDEEFELFKQGFDAACQDTEQYMLDILKLVESAE
ncbi:hypothetical protein N473_17790 [Pseudoalteromonas luteoviolacea CPMOR-1]|uniref:Uncharacterized protein n=1 Tax=Pseudoalteromonas luteoviolacea CPMOR-1 TaxID=1365248 RepID=A0A167KUB2_9GAMM|nr:hypothetical protein [Pseudoalteromonas luteoviolacea]KZN63281.1 hypothetical protein N473_17790 [Pseudoalteromonas luteoviolacea CPMOR-1]